MTAQDAIPRRGWFQCGGRRSRLPSRAARRRSRLREFEVVWLEGPKPDQLEFGKLYISCPPRQWSGHLCPCGCGKQVDIAFLPDDGFWTLIFDGKTVSITPSIGNFGQKCRSHYVIERNRVVWMD